MPYFFIILLKINLVLILFAASYYLILRRLTFYTINRLFLVFGILFSSIYPFINLTDFFHRQKQINQEVVAFVPQLNQKVNALVPANFITANWQVISLLFYVGVILMAFRLIIQFVSLYHMHRKSKPGAVAEYKVRILSEPVSPFSFWQTMYINPSLHQEKELRTILAHEHVHVKEWHSLDIILAELSVVFYWFNPGVWMMKKAVKENLEFITDQKILNKGIDRKAYQYSLLDVGNLTPAVAIVNNFNLSDLKKRIKMMNVKRSSRLTLSRYLLITPVLLLTTLAFTISKKDIKKHLMPLHQVLLSTNLIDSSAKKVASAKLTTKKRKLGIPAVIKVDTVSKLTFFIRTLFVDNDSLHTMPDEPANTRRAVIVNGTASPTKARMFFYHSDSVSTGAEIKTSKNIQLNFKNGIPLPPENLGEEKVIIVKGHRKDKLIDSALTNGNIALFINGKKVNEEEMKAIHPEDIKDVKIQKRTPVAGIRIETREPE